MQVIAFDAASSSSGSGSPFTWSHTCTGSNLVLVVALWAAAGDVVSAVTYNSIAMTQVAKTVGAALGENYLYILVNPSTGANTISVTHTSSNIMAAAASYKNASASSQPDAQTSNNSGAATTYAESLTSIADGTWHISGVFGSNGSNAISAGSNTTVEVHLESVPIGLSIAIGDNHAAISPPTSNTLNFAASSMSWWSIGITLKAAPDVFTLTIGQGSFTYTGQTVILAHGYAPFSLAQGSFTLTGEPANFTTFHLWINQTKDSSIFTNGIKDSSSWTDQAKNNSSFTNQTKN